MKADFWGNSYIIAKIIVCGILIYRFVVQKRGGNFIGCLLFMCGSSGLICSVDRAVERTALVGVSAVYADGFTLDACG